MVATDGVTAADLVRHDGGVFTMGSHDGEGRVKEVDVSAFSIGAYAVSNADVSRFVGENHRPASARSGASLWRGSECPSAADAASSDASGRESEGGSVA